MQTLALIFPLLFYLGCVAHCSDLLIKDFCVIPDIAKILDEARVVTKFVKGHKYVCALFKRIILGKSAMLTLYPETRFAYAASMLERLRRNRAHLATLVCVNVYIDFACVA